MARNNNLLLGLSALAGNDDFHYGAGIIAVERLKTIAAIPPDEQSRVDEKIEICTSRIMPVELLSNPDISPGEASNSVANAISSVCTELHFIAHDVIIGTSALIALNLLGSNIDNRIVTNIVTLVSGLKSAPPGIFHNLNRSRVKEREETFTNFDIESDENGLVGIMMSLLRAIKKTGLGFGFRAQEYHVVTHTHALVWLKKNGYTEVYRKSLKPWFFRMSLLGEITNLNESEFIPAPYSSFEFGNEAFWDRISRLNNDPHVFKASFSIFELREFGLLTEADFDFLWTEKMPFWFSPVQNEFPW